MTLLRVNRLQSLCVSKKCLNGTIRVTFAAGQQNTLSRVHTRMRTLRRYLYLDGSSQPLSFNSPTGFNWNQKSHDGWISVRGLEGKLKIQTCSEKNQPNIDPGMRKQPAARGGPLSLLHLSVSSMHSTGESNPDCEAEPPAPVPPPLF
jgi:hypothetical protein